MTEEKPFWLEKLDKQIQRSWGSTKRQLEALRTSQLNKANRPKADTDEQLLRDTLKLLTTPHFDIDKTHLIKRIEAALGE